MLAWINTYGACHLFMYLFTCMYLFICFLVTVACYTLYTANFGDEHPFASYFGMPRQALGACLGDVAEDESKGPAGCVPTENLPLSD